MFSDFKEGNDRGAQRKLFSDIQSLEVEEDIFSKVMSECIENYSMYEDSFEAFMSLEEDEAEELKMKLKSLKDSEDSHEEAVIEDNDSRVEVELYTESPDESEIDNSNLNDMNKVEGRLYSAKLSRNIRKFNRVISKAFSDGQSGEYNRLMTEIEGSFGEVLSKAIHKNFSSWELQRKFSGQELKMYSEDMEELMDEYVEEVPEDLPAPMMGEMEETREYGKGYKKRKMEKSKSLIDEEEVLPNDLAESGSELDEGEEAPAPMEPSGDLGDPETKEMSEEVTEVEEIEEVEETPEETPEEVEAEEVEAEEAPEEDEMSDVEGDVYEPDIEDVIGDNFGSESEEDEEDGLEDDVMSLLK